MRPVEIIERATADGYSTLTKRVVEHVWRPGPFTTPQCPDLAGAAVVLSLVHLTDTHVIDASSPARAEHAQLREADPKWAPVLAMHRPYELVANHAAAMLVETIRRNPVGSVSESPFSVALVTGDCTDNAQRNELDAYLSIMLGGTVSLPYDGVQSPHAGETGFWCPEASVNDEWKTRYGFPAVADLIDAVSQPLTCAGLGIPLVAAIGNHDVLRQGTALTSAGCEAWAVGNQKATALPPGFDPTDPFEAYLGDPASYLDGAPTRTVRADPTRRIVSASEWVDAHRKRGAGFSFQGGSSSNGHDSIVDLADVRIIVLDTNHPFGHFEGSIGADQLGWLNDRIGETDKWVIVATHHGTESLDNEVGPLVSESQVGFESERLHADAVLAVLHRHDRVVAWLSGHRHINRVTHRPHPDGVNQGFWEIITASTIDWPSQGRSVEILRTAGGSLVMACSPVDHAGDLVPGHDAAQTLAGVAGLHRELAANLVGPWGTPKVTKLSGRLEDKACLLGLRVAL